MSIYMKRGDKKQLLCVYPKAGDARSWLQSVGDIDRDDAPDIRVIHETVIKFLRKGKMTHNPVSLAGKSISSRNIPNKSISYAGPGSIEPQSSFSSLPRWLIIGVVLLAAFMGLYVIIYAIG
jgi:hypothetical protein